MLERSEEETWPAFYRILQSSVLNSKCRWQREIFDERRHGLPSLGFCNASSSAVVNAKRRRCWQLEIFDLPFHCLAVEPHHVM